MRNRLYNARLLTLKDGDKVTSGEVWVKDSVIEKVIIYKTDNGINNSINILSSIFTDVLFSLTISINSFLFDSIQLSVKF